MGSSSPKGTLFLTNYFSDVMIVHKYSFASFVIYFVKISFEFYIKQTKLLKNNVEYE